MKFKLVTTLLAHISAFNDQTLQFPTIPEDCVQWDTYCSICQVSLQTIKSCKKNRLCSTNINSYNGDGFCTKFKEIIQTRGSSENMNRYRYSFYEPSFNCLMIYKSGFFKHGKYGGIQITSYQNKDFIEILKLCMIKPDEGKIATCLHWSDGCNECKVIKNKHYCTTITNCL